MNKFIELLEAHCQWIAVGIGSVFLAIMLWSHILMQPAGVENGKQTLTPGNVDDIVFKNSADPLRRELERQVPESPPPQGQLSVIEPWKKVMDGKDRPVLALGESWPGSLPIKVNELQGINNPMPIEQILVKVLPQVGPSAPAAIKAARATVVQAPATPPGNNAPVIPAAGTDLNYVFYQYRINTQDLAAAFKQAQIPAQSELTTSVIAIKVYRQEELPSGDWSAPTEVKPLKNAPPTILQLPRNATPQDPEIANFLAWVESPGGIADLIRPQFYTVLLGEGPLAPHEELPVIDPDLEKADRAARLKELQQQKALDRANNRPAPPSGPPTGEDPGRPRVRPGRPLRPLVADSAQPSRYDELVGQQFAQAKRPDVFGLSSNGMPNNRPPQGFEGMPPAPDGNGAPGTNTDPQLDGLPQGRWNPATAPNIDGWIYDEDVQEGRTYRYQVVYAIRNPLFGTTGIAVLGLEKTFAIWFNDGKPDQLHWGAPVTVEPSTEYFLATTNNNWGPLNAPTQVSFEIYKWAAGRWQKASKTFAVGDRIATLDAKGTTKVAFATGAALVDIRYDGKIGTGKSYVVVMDHTGRLKELDVATEKNNIRRQQLNAAVNAANAATAGGAADAPVAGRDPRGN